MTGDPVSVADAVSVWVPSVLPRVRIVEAMPDALVTGAVSDTEPPPVPATQRTLKLPTALPWASFTTTACGFGSAELMTPACESPALLAICVAFPGVAVAVKLTGEPINPVTPAWTVLPPATDGNVSTVVTWPLPSDVSA